MKTSTHEKPYTKLDVEKLIKKLGPLVAGVHPACTTVPRIRQQDFDFLVESIKANGLLVPIQVDENRMLVDGRSRIQACRIAGVTITEADIALSTQDPELIAHANGARRHLTLNQRIMEATKWLEIFEKEAADRKRAGAEKGRRNRAKSVGTASVPSKKKDVAKRKPRSSEKAAKLMGVPRESVETAKKVKNLSPEIAERIAEDEMSLEEGCEAVGISTPKKPKSAASRSVASANKKKSTKTSSAKGDTQLGDARTRIKDRKDGTRWVRTKMVTLVLHDDVPHEMIAFGDGDSWWIGSTVEDEFDKCGSRAEAERLVAEQLNSSRKT